MCDFSFIVHLCCCYIIKGQKDNGSKALVFSNFQHTIEWLKRELEEEGMQYRTLDGGMSMKQRGKALKDFESDPSTTVFLLSIRAGAVGINLTQATHVFMMDPCQNPALEHQAVGRVHRMGQTREVHVRKLIMKDSIEGRIMKSQQKRHTDAQKKRGATVGNAQASSLYLIAIKKGLYKLTGAASMVGAKKKASKKIPRETIASYAKSHLDKKSEAAAKKESRGRGQQRRNNTQAIYDREIAKALVEGVGAGLLTGAACGTYGSFGLTGDGVVSAAADAAEALQNSGGFGCGSGRGPVSAGAGSFAGSLKEDKATCTNVEELDAMFGI